MPWKILIAEGLQNDDAITRDALFGGMGLDGQWDPGFKMRVRDLLFAPNDDIRRASSVAEAVGKSYNRSGPFARVIYTESHDEAKDQRITDRVGPGNAEGWLARKLSALGAALTFTSPSIPMLFMGQEFLEFARWNDSPSFALDFGRIGLPGKLSRVLLARWWRIAHDGITRTRILGWLVQEDVVQPQSSKYS